VTATYRLQLHAGFTFADAERVAPYVADLGATHLYLSPVLEAVPGSMHGYDVVDHTRVSEALGGQAGLERLADTARQHGLGLVVDVVPNHMALVAPLHTNAPLWRALAEGREAETAHWFDVDWDALDGRIGLPVLGDTLDATMAAGELVLDEHAGRPVVRYHEHVFPVAEGTAAAVRVMPPVFAMGEAAGTAAALAIEYGVEPRAIPIPQLQQMLVRQGAYLGEKHKRSPAPLRF
jgi:(1->4)-alpha-D-glucan 1-alpha-D-glucosylmutase